MKFKQSLTFLEKAKKIIPSAAQTYSKSYTCYCEGAAPAFIERGEKACVFDVDGNKYIDFLLGLGPVTLGYNHPKINEAIINQLEKGISFTLSHPLEVELAQKIIDIVPCAQMVKFVKNGSDATTAAVRLARAYTNRDIICCAGYHGFHDWYVGGTVNNKGVPQAVSKLTKRFQFNDIESLEKLFNDNKNQVAAVILEPVTLEEPKDNFLEKVKKLCSKNGTVLIFDEVITGFRVGLGGAQGYYDIIPDLCTMGKGVANGMPLSFVTGRKDIMTLIDEGVFVSTTFGGETLSIAAALETIKIMEKEDYFSHTWALGRRWIEKVDQVIQDKKAGLFAKTAGLPPHSGIIFSDYNNIPLEDFKTIFIQEIISRGILSLGVNNYCLDHTMADVDQYVDAVGSALDICQLAVEEGSIENRLKGGRFLPVFARN